jgi:hypothetical protein
MRTREIVAIVRNQTCLGDTCMHATKGDDAGAGDGTTAKVHNDDAAWLQ